MKRCLVLIAVAQVACVALADFTDRPLESAGMLSGSEDFYAAAFGKTLDVAVDYAVFAPGTYTGTVTRTFGSGVFDINEYVYAYQVYNNGPLHGTGDTPVHLLSIGLERGQASVSGFGVDSEFDRSAEDIEPEFGYILPGSIELEFHNADYGGGVQFFEIGADQFSMTIVFSSPLVPGFAQASIQDSGLADQGLLPSPVPAPGAALLAALGLGIVQTLRRKMS